MVRAGREVRSRADYILGMYCCLFCSVSAQDPRHNSYHYLVLGCLRSAPLRRHSEYLGRRKRIPLQPLTTQTREDGIFAYLQSSVTNPKARGLR